jgi:outer membrane immunogenic protein
MAPWNGHPQYLFNLSLGQGGRPKEVVPHGVLLIMKKLFVSAVVVASMAAVPAFAQSWSTPSYYGSVGYTALDLDEVDADVGAITGRIGARFNPYFGVEGEASFGVKDDDVTFGGVAANVDHKYDLAAYAVGSVPLSPNFELFGRVGYGTTEAEVEALGVTTDISGESWNYGVGANYYFDGQNGVRGDWTRRDFTDNGGEIDTYAVSYIRRF